MFMFAKNTRARQRGRASDESPGGIQRLDVLGWFFSSSEIERLGQLQLRYREHPDSLDMPLDECRLRFARWLLEHGKLSEEYAADLVGTPPAADGAAGACLPDCAAGEASSVPVASLPSTDTEDRRAEDAALGWYPLAGAWARLRRGLAKLVASWREPELPPPAPHEFNRWLPYYRWQSYDGLRSSADSPWLWLYFRHDC